MLLLSFRCLSRPALEVLDGALVPLRGRSSVERAEVAPCRPRAERPSKSGYRVGKAGRSGGAGGAGGGWLPTSRDARLAASRLSRAAAAAASPSTRPSSLGTLPVSRPRALRSLPCVFGTSSPLDFFGSSMIAVTAAEVFA